MPSPFPGMDPYIESQGYWGDLHANMIVAMQQALNRRMPKGFAASIDIYVWIHEPPADQRSKRAAPELYIAGEKRSSRVIATARQRGAKAIVLPNVERRKRRYIRIEDLKKKRGVTAIELLSPSDKVAGLDHDVYMAKRAEFIGGETSFVEIDLLRGGRRMPLGDTESDSSDYYVMVARFWEFPRADYWAFGLRDELPSIEVPLLPDMKPVMLDLQSAFATCYEGSLYADKIDYAAALKPRPSKDDVTWMENRIARAARRVR